jgi:uncharacterized protein (UPF0210 family)
MPSMSSTSGSSADLKHLFCVRTVTCFVSLQSEDLNHCPKAGGDGLTSTIRKASDVLRHVQSVLEEHGYVVQTTRLVTNPFGEWLLPLTNGDTAITVQTTIAKIDRLLEQHDIEFCALGPARTVDELPICINICSQSHRISCSARLEANDVAMARAAAETVIALSKLDHGPHVANGLANFRFCVASSNCNRDGSPIPFFPAATAILRTPGTEMTVAIGLENGALAHELIGRCRSIANIPTEFARDMTKALTPLQEACEKAVCDYNTSAGSAIRYLGMDTSLNPSLDPTLQGSVAAAIETLDEVQTFGGPGSLAAAAAITTSIQSLPGIRQTGYCGLMLPVCEDRRLAELADSNAIRISDLLSVSHVCGVGVDTVPIAADSSIQELQGLMLDVVGLATRWGKSLSCRVFPVPGKRVGDITAFESQYMINAKILPIS